MPIQTYGQAMIVDLDWKDSPREEGGSNRIFVGLKSLEALTGANPGPVEPIWVFEAHFQFVPGQKFLVYDSPIYSLSLQINPDKENK